MTHPADVQQIILQSLEAIRAEQSRQGEDIAAIKANLHSILGNGQPGRLTNLENDVKALSEWKAHSKGWFAGVGAVLTVAGAFGHWVIDALRTHKP